MGKIESPIEARIDLVAELFRNGKKAGSLSPDTSPWVARSLEVLEGGEELTAEKLEQIDIAQNTQKPPKK
jgi:hypothetical protein